MNAVAKTYQKGEIPGVVAIRAAACKGCDACKRYCPTGAITGSFGATHGIDVDLCLSCGQCLISCPFEAVYETDDAVDKVISKLQDKSVSVVGIIAPAVRVAIGEEFGMKTGSLVTGKLYASMKKAGIEILDNNFAADLTIMEEGSELISRARHAIFGEKSPHGEPIGPLPQFTSCCPAWVRYVETQCPKLIPHLSSAKSPQQMAGTVAKTYGTKVWKKPASQIFTVGIMPCTAKKFEASRPEFSSAYEYNKKQNRETGPAYPDVDVVLTTRDLARLFKKMNIDLSKEANYNPDILFAEYSGAGTIFGNTGGVMEAAVRTAYAVLTGEELANVEFKSVRGLKGVKSASVTLKDAKYDKEVTIRLAVVHDMARNIKPIVNDVLAGKSPYHFIEVMNCPAGCINGGGQPIDKSGSSWVEAIRPLFAWK
jgi:ferredoxin hydrogenase large subunit